MTVDEALAAARTTSRCLIFWNSATGEFVEVLKLEQQADHAQISSIAQELFRRYNATFSHQVFDSATISRDILQQRQNEAIRVTARKNTLRQWAGAGAEELLGILEQRAYPSSMVKDFDSTILVDHLWALHRNELTPARQERMRLLAGTECLSPKASFHANAYCLALQGENNQLSDLWRSEFDARRSFDGVFVLLECFCHTQTQDLGIIHDIIGMIDQPAWLFYTRLKAVVAVGTLDAARQTNAAEIISRAIHDSTPHIISTRDRAIERLTTEPAIWRRCQSCCHGQIHGESCVPAPCPVCLGFGTVRY